MSGIKPALLDKPAFYFATTLTELVSSNYIKASKFLKTVLLRITNFYMKTEYFLSNGSLMQITNRKTERKDNIFPDGCRD